ncbi:uncharacterized protein TRIADDRAFT_63933 [Trichoplax adhaerens]|uniref:Cytochrome P450 n=1 Tax=Trichoplax adhaerens TaxID=10228 RepID=B3RXH0_TRIAD|nr:hypothetical protein TRIADDRAFT_63933 [Trichoplax adhaerens]EDV24424.1 hypothetical protein TRIADDRAFT_63933 [Trichoplax adhaerens]|eukprot:XP_002112314.1 hypothetical protein TRIADDRAFT_63933 [Trichoplax adhaerens]
MAIQDILVFLFVPQSITHFIELTAIIGLAILIYRIVIDPYRRLKKLGLAGPKFKPVIGNIADWGPTGQHLALLEWRKKYGNVFATMFFGTPTVWIGEPNMVREVMVKSFSNFSNRFPPFGKPISPFDKGVLFLKDDDWKRVRNILITTFSASKLKQIVPLMKDIDAKFIEELVETNQVDGKVNILDHAGYFSLEVVLAIIFGIEYESKEQKIKLARTAKDLVEPIQGFLLIIFLLCPSMWKIIEPYFGTIVQSINKITDLTNEIVKQRRKNLNAGLPCRKDMLQLIVEAGDQEKLSDEEIISQAIIFFIAGYDTTSNTIAYASYLLATHPEIQDKLYQEICTKCPDVNSIDYEILNNLTYLDMVISETLRLYPPGFFSNREVKKEVTIEGVRIPNDSIVGIPIYTIHHNPQFWPDPEQFIPERFTPEEKAKRNPCCYLPFGDGPRNCVGMRLALLEVKLALVSLMQNLELKTVADTEVPLKLKTGGTLTAANGIWLGLGTR